MNGSSVTEPINVYRVKPDKNLVGWIILSIVLTVALVTFMLLWIFSINEKYNQPESTICFGPFGIQTNVDSDPINQCGTNKSDPCIFAKNSVADAEAECNTLKSICSAFTFNTLTSTMKIVQPTNTFMSIGTNLFVRQ